MSDNQSNIEIFTSFEKMGLKDNIMRGVYSYGFEFPSEIQSKGIKKIIDGKDLVAQSQAGTGKTGTFIIGALEKIDENVNGCQVVIIAPTRELAAQIQEVCKSIGTYLKMKTVLCVGGSNIQESRKEIDSYPSIVIGTPGRIIDMLDKGYLTTKAVKLLVLDEADEMLAGSFIDQMKTIVSQLSQSCQICLFSATMPQEILDITDKFMNKPENILIKQEELTLDGIKQFFINVEQERWKFETFCDLFDLISVSQTIVYVNSKQRAEMLKDMLEDKHFPVSVMHSNMTPLERIQIMKNFRSGGTRILISTDLLARGIDVQQVSIVINYDLPNLPQDKELYIHRIGRSGRFGRKGVSISFVTKRDYWKINELRKQFNTTIEPMPKNFNEFLS